MSISAINADAFVTEVLNGETVWTIRAPGGFSTSTDSSGQTAMPFWSSEKRARRIIENVAAYGDCEPEPIPLSVFVGRWLPGLRRDGLHCGVNWAGKRATGYDISPDDLMDRFKARGLSAPTPFTFKVRRLWKKIFDK